MTRMTIENRRSWWVKKGAWEARAVPQGGWVGHGGWRGYGVRAVPCEYW